MRNTSMSTEPVLARLQASEINASIASFFDNCWTARLGDELNGWTAEAVLDSYAEAEAWLDRTARERFPDSAYARTTRDA